MLNPKVAPTLPKRRQGPVQQNARRRDPRDPALQTLCLLATLSNSALKSMLPLRLPVVACDPRLAQPQLHLHPALVDPLLLFLRKLLALQNVLVVPQLAGVPQLLLQRRYLLQHQKLTFRISSRSVFRCRAVDVDSL